MSCRPGRLKRSEHFFPTRLLHSRRLRGIHSSGDLVADTPVAYILVAYSPVAVVLATYILVAYNLVVYLVFALRI